MPNYRNERGEVGTYQDHPIIITTYATLNKNYKSEILDPNSYYAITDFDPVRKLTKDRMNLYRTCKDTYTTGKMAFIGYLYNDGKINIEPSVGTNLFTPKQQPREERPIATAPEINFSEYTRVVDEFMRDIV